jgi:rhamnose transport system substrate-binding protein
MNRTIVLTLALAVVTAGVLAAGSSGARQDQRTIGLVLPDPNTGAPLSTPVKSGGSTAASALGDHLVVIPADGPGAITSAVKSLIARHAGAIVVNTDQGAETVKQILPALAKARKARIPTLSYDQRIPGTVWVTGSTPHQYAQALADALASQMGGTGQYAIIGQQGQQPIANRWQKLIASYVARQYPSMKLIKVVRGTGAGNETEVATVKQFIAVHPKLRGLLGVVPTEGYMVANAIIQAHKIGKIFASGNGGICPPLDVDQARYVRDGAEEIVCAGDPVKLGYLVVWAADHLASGHTIAPGSYAVGGPVGTVTYDAKHQDLPLGQPLTITKANLDQYLPKSG